MFAFVELCLLPLNYVCFRSLMFNNILVTVGISGAGGTDSVPKEGGGHHARVRVRHVPQAHLQLGLRRLPGGHDRALQLHP